MHIINMNECNEERDRKCIKNASKLLVQMFEMLNVCIFLSDCSAREMKETWSKKILFKLANILVEYKMLAELYRNFHNRMPILECRRWNARSMENYTVYVVVQY